MFEKPKKIPLVYNVKWLHLHKETLTVCEAN